MNSCTSKMYRVECEYYKIKTFDKPNGSNLNHPTNGQ